MEGMEGGGEVEDKRLFTHGTQSQRTAKEPGACAVFSDGSLAPNNVQEKKEGGP